jgi:hypothetical protein
MKIDPKTLLTIVPREARSRVAVGVAIHIVQRSYCGRMTSKGLCTENCDNCQASLLNIFRLEDAQNPEALLTWLCKAQVASNEEKANEHTVVIHKDALGIPLPTSENVFADLLKEFT